MQVNASRLLRLRLVVLVARLAVLTDLGDVLGVR